MNDIKIIPKPESQIPSPGSVDMRKLERILVSTDNDSAFKIAEMIQGLLLPIKSLEIERQSQSMSNSILINFT